MKTDARPTLRCLREDIDMDWDSAADQGAAQRMSISKPLPELEHPIIRKAKGDFPGESADSDVSRESISGLSDPVWWKVKIGARWRGAVYEDPASGQAWLCAAGYRREGEASDFYKRFMNDVAAKGATHFLPSPDDNERLESELRERELDRWSSQLQVLAREAVIEVWSGGSADFTVFHPRDVEVGIAKCAIEVAREDVDGVVVVDLVVTTECVDFTYLALVQWVELVVLASVDPREQSWGVMPVGGTSTASQMLEGPEVEALEITWGETLEPGEIKAGDTAHFAHRNRLTESTVEGEAVRSMCGIWFVPRQDHATMPRCGHCEAVYQAMPE